MPLHDGQTLFVPKDRPTSFIDRATTGLPLDLLNRSARRLEILAWLYAFTFLMAAFVPPLPFPALRQALVSHPANWAPGVISIAVAIAVALAIRLASLKPATVTIIALVFEVLSSYGIAAAEFLRPEGMEFSQSAWTGLSWVAVWMPLFNVVVPTAPRYAAFAALASATSVPVMITLSLRLFPSPSPGALMLFVMFGFPYLLVVIMAYVGARVVYSLGTEVTRARELGSYRLETRLGQGGMGEVWRASHRLLARPAAIKLIRSSLAGHGSHISDDARRRFEREAQVIARLRSPHTVTLFDFGITDDGSFYYVMELLDGLDAESMVKRFGPMPAERVVQVLRQMCHSLSEAQSCGLVHRDIKPANIFLCRYGEEHDFVKVLDFGIAKAVRGPSAKAETAITVGSVIQGTPAFIAPEQATGGDVDGRADIYSTGCVAYWLLTGELVFTADTAIRLLLAHAQAEPDPPSARTELPIPAALEALVMACLAKDRDLRPSSARDLLRRLDALPLERAWSAERAREWWQSHLPPREPTGQS
jgi:eukaryotic-like serine/threonine-protein kinase